MHVLFIHQAFPAQFGQLGLDLVKRFGWKCSFLVKDLSNCPTPSREMLDRLELRRIPLPADFPAQKVTPWPQSYGRYLDVAKAVFEGIRTWPGLRPDLVVGHHGLGPTLFVPELLDCPVVDYCEIYFAPSHGDISYRLDLPPAEPAPFYPRSINAAALASLVNCTAGYTPTHWQRQTFPARFHRKIEVHFDGIDTDLYRPRQMPRVVGGQAIPAEMKIVTFVARGLESMRGFDLFMRVAQQIARERSDVVFVVVGKESSCYSWDKLHTGQENFKEWVVARGDYDLSRFIFLGQVEPAQLADLFCLSDLHIYLTVPFVPSWSLFNALACSCIVVASDVEPVREIITPGVHGLLEPLFDTERMAETAMRVLDDPATYRPLGEAGRRLIEEKYGIEVCLPRLKNYFERVATTAP